MILPTLLAWITGHQRYIPEFEWSDLWTYNLFRVYESVFGRRVGIRREMSMDFEGNYYCHSFESVIVFAEVKIREFFKDIFAFKLVKVYLPQFAPAGFNAPLNAPYLLAIARDTGLSRAGAGPVTEQTRAFTCTGSNLILCSFVGSNSGNDDLTGVTYAGSALTLGIKSSGPTVRTWWRYWYYLKAPATGANDCVASYSASITANMAIVSYSGAAQTGGIDASNAYIANSGESGNITVTATISTANSWMVVGMLQVDADPTAVVNGAQTIGGGGITTGDSNAAVGSGAQTIGFTWDSADRHSIIGMGFAPAAAATATPLPPQIIFWN